METTPSDYIFETPTLYDSNCTIADNDTMPSYRVVSNIFHSLSINSSSSMNDLLVDGVQLVVNGGVEIEVVGSFSLFGDMLVKGNVTVFGASRLNSGSIFIHKGSRLTFQGTTTWMNTSLDGDGVLEVTQDNFRWTATKMLHARGKPSVASADGTFFISGS